MNSGGRPSHRKEDLKAIVTMAEMLFAKGERRSVGYLSRYLVGLEPQMGFEEHEIKEKNARDEEIGGRNRSKPNQSSEALLVDSWNPRDIVGSGKPKGVAKRLERLFLVLNKQDQIIPVAAYRTRDMLRHRYLLVSSLEVVGPFFEASMQDSQFVKADREALEETAKLIGVTLEEASELSATGLSILRDWFPRDYPKSRI